MISSEPLPPESTAFASGFSFRYFSATLILPLNIEDGSPVGRTCAPSKTTVAFSAGLIAEVVIMVMVMISP